MLAARQHLPAFPAESGQVTVLRHDLPPARAGEAVVGRLGEVAADADHSPGNLRVRVIEVEGLAARPDGSSCEPYATVAVAELTRRRTRRVDAAGPGPSVVWDRAFDFEDTSACAQVVVDVWDARADGPAELLGKALLSLADCRAGVPHTHFKNLLEGKLVLRVLFDFAELPSEEEEQAAYEQMSERLVGGHV